MKVYLFNALLILFLQLNYLDARTDLTRSELDRVNKAIAVTDNFSKAERSEAPTVRPAPGQ